MDTNFYPLEVANIVRETSDAVSVHFNLSNELKDKFGFEAGQYLTFKYQNNGEEIRRSYSISSSINDEHLRVGIKQVEGGIFSSFANTGLKVGDTLESMLPMGNFTTDISPNNDLNYVAFAAGSGITPIMSLIKAVLEQEPQSTFKLIYGNKGFQSIMYREELEAIKNKYLQRFQVVHVFSRELMESDINNGRINSEKCSALYNGILRMEETSNYSRLDRPLNMSRKK